jgi:putrescine aminotransferase
LLIGLEFAQPALVGQLVLELLERGILVNHSLNAGRVLRLTPSAVVTDAELGLFLEAFHDAYTALAEYAADAHFMKS